MWGEEDISPFTLFFKIKRRLLSNTSVMKKKRFQIFLEFCCNFEKKHTIRWELGHELRIPKFIYDA